MFDIQEISATAEAGARREAATTARLPQQKQTMAKEVSQPSITSPSSTLTPEATATTQPSFTPPRGTELARQSERGYHGVPASQPELSGPATFDAHLTSAAQPHSDCGHLVRDTQVAAAAVGTPTPNEGHSDRDTQTCGALVGEITAIYRRYEDLRRARQRIELQAMATCRTVCGGDKVAGMKLYKSPTPQVAVWLAPYEAAMQPLADAIKAQEKLLTKLGKQLPVAAWADTVPGLSPRFLAAIVGECGIGPGEYRTVSALWKRMGMAVINGGRQRRVTGDAALEHGYVARRRSLMWNIGDQVAVRQGVRNPKGEDGKPTGAVPINPWGALYLERKAYELAREIEPGKPITPMHAHNRAKRYVEKRLLRSLWQEWRRATIGTQPSDHLPDASNASEVAS